MATSTYLSNPVVTVNSVDLSDQCTAATINRTFEALENTSFGDTSRKFTAGLQVLEVTLTLYMSYAATETYATLNALVGTTTNIEIKPTSAALSATNPNIVITGAYLETLPVISAGMGELSTIDITFTGGTYAAVTAGP
jgi:hypothetical protein